MRQRLQNSVADTPAGDESDDDIAGGVVVADPSGLFSAGPDQVEAAPIVEPHDGPSWLVRRRAAMDMHLVHARRDLSAASWMQNCGALPREPPPQDSRMTSKNYGQ